MNMTATASEHVRTGRDKAEGLARSVDQATTGMTGTSIFHWLTIASIVASIVLFVSGRRMEGIFVGLWPPTFQALKAGAEQR
jgi:hypothetical protein